MKYETLKLINMKLDSVAFLVAHTVEVDGETVSPHFPDYAKGYLQVKIPEKRKMLKEAK